MPSRKIPAINELSSFCLRKKKSSQRHLRGTQGKCGSSSFSLMKVDAFSETDKLAGILQVLLLRQPAVDVSPPGRAQNLMRVPVNQA